MNMDLSFSSTSRPPTIHSWTTDDEEQWSTEDGNVHGLSIARQRQPSINHVWSTSPEVSVELYATRPFVRHVTVAKPNVPARVGNYSFSIRPRRSTPVHHRRRIHQIRIAMMDVTAVNRNFKTQRVREIKASAIVRYSEHLSHSVTIDEEVSSSRRACEATLIVSS